MTNASDKAVEFDRPRWLYGHVMVFDADGAQMWASRPWTGIERIWPTRLGPGERVTYETPWDQRDQDGFAAPPGRYLVRTATHISDDGDEEDGGYRRMDLATEPHELVIEP